MKMQLQVTAKVQLEIYKSILVQWNIFTMKMNMKLD